MRQETLLTKVMECWKAAFTVSNGFTSASRAAIDSELSRNQLESNLRALMSYSTIIRMPSLVSTIGYLQPVTVAGTRRNAAKGIRSW
jgi:hypothetical protein